MLQRGVIVSHETIRLWCARFGQAYADDLRRRRARPGDRWHLDEGLTAVVAVMNEAGVLLDPRLYSVISIASRGSSVHMWFVTRQPTIIREYTSRTNATYTQPDQVRTWVMSATHS